MKPPEPRPPRGREREARAPSAAEEQLRIVLDTLSEGIVVANQAREILLVNRAAEELWGYPRRKLVGKPLSYLLSVEAREGLRSAWEDREHGLAGQRLILEGYRADSSSFPVEISITEAPVDGEVRLTLAARDLSRIRRLESRLRHLEKAVERMPVGVTIADLERRLLYANPAAGRMHGYAPEELEGRDAQVLAPRSLWPDIEYARLAETGAWRREATGRRKDGSSFAVEVMPEVVTGPEGDPTGIVTIFHDITERKRAEEALRRSEERYALAMRGANDGLWDWDLKADEIYYSPRWRAMLGLEDDEIRDRPEEWLRRVHPEDRPALKEALRRHLSGETRLFESEYRMAHSDGAYRWMLARGLAVWDEEGEPERMAGSQADITDRKVNDPLTGLPNRALFLDRVGRALERSRRRDGAPLAVLYLDVDRFKVINESLGHGAGDQLILALARRVADHLAAGDTLARLGGDELAILLEEGGSRRDAERLAEELAGSLAEPFELAGQEVFSTVSLGIALGPGDYRHPEEMLRDADTAMHRAKALGRARHQVFDQEMRDRAVVQLRMETDLRRALERGELELYYQPIVSLPHDAIYGFEALLRWNHPELGLLLPLEFIPLAEETGLILPIGAWVLRQACWQARAWQREFQAEPPLTMSINLSARQLAQGDLVEQMRGILGDTGVDPRSLKLEITESAVIDNQEAAVATLHALRELGVKISIDDFGTGYSSLSYLHRFPVDTLKIDRSFIGAMGVEEKKEELVKAIVGMARDLGVDVVAEGVETGEQLANLRTLACEYMQGFCFSRPLDQEGASKMLASRGVGKPRVKLIKGEKG